MMTPHSGEMQGTQELATLADLARSSVEPATLAQLSQGLHAVSARLAVEKA
jgi:hypothetical protein